jgi:hypothetical protein
MPTSEELNVVQEASVQDMSEREASEQESSENSFAASKTPPSTPIKRDGAPIIETVVRRCGRFTLIRCAEGFRWHLATRRAVWHWHVAIGEWTAAQPHAYATEAEATVGLAETLGHEEIGDLDEQHVAPAHEGGFA